MVRGEDLTSFDQSGKQRVEILPAACDSVKEHERRAIPRADRAIQCLVAEPQHSFLHLLHSRYIPVAAGRDSRIGGRRVLVMRHAVFAPENERRIIPVKPVQRPILHNSISLIDEPRATR